MAKKASKPDIVVQNISLRPIQRKTQDIGTWRNAIKRFENDSNPNRVSLYDLYADVMLDGHMESVWGKRQDALTTRELVFFDKDGKEDDDVSKLLNCPDMRSLIKDLHDSIAWGYTLVEINTIEYDPEEESYKIDYDLIPRKHVHPEDGFECVSKDQNQATRDFLYKEPPLSKYMIWAGKNNDMGLLIKAAQYVIYKRGGYGDWAQFSELFGMPFREARYDDYDDNTRQTLEKAMDNWGGNAWAVLPKSADFKLHDAVKGTAGNLYKMLTDSCNAEISKAILGNTLTTEQGQNGARSLGEVHQEVEVVKHVSDLKFIRDILNTKFKAILKLFGFDVTGGDIRFNMPPADWSKLKQKWEVIRDLRKEIPIDDDFLYDEFGVPKPDNYQEMRGKMDDDKYGNGPNTSGDDNARLSISQRLKDFFV